MKSPTERQSGFFSVAVLIAAIALAAAGGLMYVHYKNRQYLVDRRIERVESRIEKNRDEIRTMRMEMDRALNCFVVAQELERRGSNLQQIPPEIVEVIPSGAGADAAMVSNQP
jgi:hypothetical protein